MTTLLEIRQKLEAKVGKVDTIPFWAVNTRLFLRTGVDLKSYDPAQGSDPEVVKNVESALAALGYKL
jgi:hypothetical protein